MANAASSETAENRPAMDALPKPRRVMANAVLPTGTCSKGSNGMGSSWDEVVDGQHHRLWGGAPSSQPGSPLGGPAVAYTLGLAGHPAAAGGVEGAAWAGSRWWWIGMSRRTCATAPSCGRMS